ncbi:MAG TPA: TetR/AcrR family transcriptional regulator [Microbacteriaceae bacterium]
MTTKHPAVVRAVPAADRVVKPQARTAAKRERILEAAMSVFGTKGYNHGSLLEIAEQANMTHAGVLHHFGSKDQLLVAMLEYRDQADVAHLEGQHPPIGKDLLLHLVETTKINSMRAGVVQTYAVLAAESVTENHPAQEFFRSRFTGLRGMIAEAFREMAPDDVDEAKLWQAASAVIGAMDGLQVQWLLDPDAVDMPHAVGAVIESLSAWLKGKTD